MMGQRRSRIVAAKDFGKGSRHGAVAAAVEVLEGRGPAMAERYSGGWEGLTGAAEGGAKEWVCPSLGFV